MKLWPAIDISGGKVVRLLQGDPGKMRTYDVTPEDAARLYESEGADGLHLVDLDAALSRGENGAVIRRVMQAVKLPIQVGGGIRSRKAIDTWLADGAARVVLGSLPFTDPLLFEDLVDARGPKIVVALDCLDGLPRVHGWTAPSEEESLDAPAYAECFGALGVKTLLVTDIAKDGTLTGPNAELLRSVRHSFSGEILASGGVRNAEDLPAIASALDGGEGGVVLGRALLEGFVTIRSLKERTS